jgi:protein-S-isoprenylcysteine O-methyltransferase Ste14
VIGLPSSALWFLATILALCLASVVFFLALGRASVMALRRHRASALRYLKQCAVAALPLLMGVIIFVCGFFNDPLWPDQDETPERHAVYLAAQEFAGRFYLASALLSAGGLIWFSRAAIASPGCNSTVRGM